MTNRRQVLRLGIAVVAGVVTAPAIAQIRTSLAAPRPAQPFPPNDGLPSPVRFVVPALRGDGPLLSPVVSTGEVYQGGALRVGLPGASAATASLLGRTYPFTETASGLAAYIGVGVLDPPGPTTLTIDAVDPILGPTLLERPIVVLATDWTVDYVVLPAGTGGETDPNYAVRVQEEIALLAATYGLVTARAWDEPWLTPITARISGYFGEQRSFNGGPVCGHHGGTDFAADAGSTVSTTNAGTVVVARNLAVRGNMVIVDHGSGVLSGYAHLAEFNVVEGQVIGKGQPVGKVGSTGLSTGPHLHWELSVHGILVDGLRWLDGSQGF